MSVSRFIFQWKFYFLRFWEIILFNRKSLTLMIIFKVLFGLSAVSFFNDNSLRRLNWRRLIVNWGDIFYLVNMDFTTICCTWAILSILMPIWIMLDVFILRHNHKTREFIGFGYQIRISKKFVFQWKIYFAIRDRIILTF